MINVLKAKLHRATVTSCLLNYEGSCAIDQDWLDQVGIREYEQIHIWNVNNGERFTTYAINAPRGSGEISIRGAAAWKARVDDIVIIAAFEIIETSESIIPKVIHFGPNNVMKEEI